MNVRIKGICIKNDATDQVKFAAKELQFYFSLMIGKKIEITDNPESAVIITADVSGELGHDGFKITPVTNGVCISGGKRGVIYAAYELLERLGFRFYTPDCEKIPSADRIELSLDGEETHLPAFEYREHNYKDPCLHPRFAVKCRLNGMHHKIPQELGSNVTYAWFVHTIEKMIPTSVYAQSHPEYYALCADGVSRNNKRAECQICMSNPDVLEIAVESVRRALTENPQAKIISISQNDSHDNYCHCPQCSQLAEKEGSQAAVIIRFVNAIAQRLENEFPDVLFDTLAYTFSRVAPKTVRPRHNVCVRLCSIEACFSHPFERCDCAAATKMTGDESRSFSDDLNDWGKTGAKLYIWDYVTCFAHYPSPHPNWRAIPENMKAFKRNGVIGVFEQANGSMGGGVDLNEMRAYLISKLLWNPSADADEIIREFSDYYYGAAGKAVREYINCLCDRADSENIHVGFNDDPTSPLFDEQWLSRYGEILDRAEAAVSDDPVRLLRVRKIRLSLSWIRIKRAAQLRSEPIADELRDFVTAWKSYGLTRVDEWVDLPRTVEALFDGRWRGIEYLEHFTDEAQELL